MYFFLLMCVLFYCNILYVKPSQIRIIAKFEMATKLLNIAGRCGGVDEASRAGADQLLFLRQQPSGGGWELAYKAWLGDYDNLDEITHQCDVNATFPLGG